MFRTFLLAWRLVRGSNLLLLLGTMGILLYQANIQLPLLLALALLLGGLCIAAAGNILNDILDQKIDERNRAERRIIGVAFSESGAWKAYYTLNSLALLVALSAQNWCLLVCFCLAIWLLWRYSNHWKCRPWLGNLAIAFLCALSLLQLLIIEPAQWNNYWRLGVLVYASFAFLTNWIRELVKDIEDERGDRKEACQTLVVVQGRKYSLKIAGRLCNALLGWLIFQIGLLGNYQLWIAFVYTSCVLIPCALYIKYVLFKRPSQKEIGRLSQLLKGYMLLGLLGFMCL